MDNYETEEQQVEAIKKWWIENYKMVIVAVVVGLGSIIGVQQWKSNKAMNAQNASMQYDQILQSVSANSAEGADQAIVKGIEVLQSDYAGSPYSALASLLEAKKLVEAGKPLEAEKNYHWIINNSSFITLQHIARIRLATLQSAEGKNEEALKLLDVDMGSFKAGYMEIKGDILVSLNRINEAKAAYDQALQAYAAIGANAQILEVKRNDLGNS
ncbi:MAG: tetratricopeptide repeat protein [gamma proteobacterium symbiont of Taylorina sp.]|nr:tetratricopeptide repeat protein [gamma proteobacterium symbiont of Taylorina sp.]